MTPTIDAPPAPAAAEQLKTTFRDAAGREWRVRLSLGMLGTVRREAGVALGDLMRDPAAIGEFLFSDPEKLGRICWLLCQDQAAAAGVTEDEFNAAFDGSTLQAGVEAVIGAVADFFPRSPVSALLKRGMTSMLGRLDAAMVTAMEASLSTWSNSAGTSAAPPASTPGPSPSAS